MTSNPDKEKEPAGKQPVRVVPRNHDAHYVSVTRDISVSVRALYLEDESDPHEPRHVWAYTIRINNLSSDAVRLRTRYWEITDSAGYTNTVSGTGVVGKQPVIRPGEGFEYTSGAPLGTPSGMMTGKFGMETLQGAAFDVDVPAFSLDSPYDPGWIH